jgi:lipopolysaccharide export system ATP-binding protein
MKLLEVNGLSKYYGRRKVVDDVSLHVNRGEIVGLLGPNGAGKTTTFYMVVGIVPPDEGTVMFDDQDITHLPVHVRSRYGIGYLSQEPSVFTKLTVEENIMAVLETIPMTWAARRKRLDELLGDLNISHLRKSKAYTLSGGEKRRLEITRALVKNPSFILLDEPFSGIDPIVVNEAQQMIKKLRDKGIGILITDHNVRETLSIVDRAYILAQGRILLSGKSDDLIESKEAKRVYLGENFKM